MGPGIGNAALPQVTLCRPTAMIPGPLDPARSGHSVGAWRSLAARIVRDDEVGGSNPLAPTIRTNFSSNAQEQRHQGPKASDQP